MAQTNFTPILTYKSDTATAVPPAGNLTNSANGAELAVNTADKRLFTKDSGGSVIELGTNPSSVTLPNGTANGVVFANGSKVLTTGSALTFNGSDFGVSASIATATLASSGAYSALSFTNSGGASSSGLVLVNSSGIMQTRAATQQWTNADASSEYMRLTSTGLGIGTSSPNTSLQVSGNAFIGVNTSGGLGPQTGLTVVGGATVSSGSPGTLTLGSHLNSRVIGDQIGKIDFFSNDASGGASGVQASIRGVTETSIGDAAGLGFYTGTSSSLLERMRLDSSGNLGLGVTPSSTIWSGDETRLVVKGNGASKAGVLALQSQGTTNSTTAFFVAEDLRAGASLGTSTNSFLALLTNGSERARIDTSGNLGLGVTPKSGSGGVPAFEISGSGTGFTSQGAFNAFSQNVYYASGWKYAATGAAASYWQDGGVHKWFTAPSGTAGNAISFTQAMSLDANGNLTLGTTSAIGRLAVVGDYAFFRENSAGADVYIRGYYGNANVAAIQVTSDSPLAFLTNNTERARIDSSGNLIQTVNTTAATLATNNTLTFSIVDNSTLRISVRGSDGTTRTATVALT